MDDEIGWIVMKLEIELSKEVFWFLDLKVKLRELVMIELILEVFVD